MRPVLTHAAHRLWRDRQTLQLGRTPGRAHVLAGVDPSTRTVLGLLDGSRDVPQVVAAATTAGFTAQRTHALLDLLRQAGLLSDADARWPAGVTLADRDRLAPDVLSLALQHQGAGVPVLVHRDRAAVLVVGAGRVGAPLAALLAASGVGVVDIDDAEAARPTDTAPGGLAQEDVGRPRGPAARERLRRYTPSTRTGPVAHPDLVVLAPAGRLDEMAVDTLVRGAVPHLLAEVRETVGVVGPLVLPGRTACLTCLDHTRTDRDPQWPVMADQLAIRQRQLPACDSALAAAVAAQAALQVLTLLDGALPASVDGSLELALPDWRWRRRSWERHPSCGCHWQQAS